MKNINKTELHMNKIINVLRYIVFIMAFVFVIAFFSCSKSRVSALENSVEQDLENATVSFNIEVPATSVNLKICTEFEACISLNLYTINYSETYTYKVYQNTNSLTGTTMSTNIYPDSWNVKYKRFTGSVYKLSTLGTVTINSTYTKIQSSFLSPAKKITKTVGYHANHTINFTADNNIRNFIEAHIHERLIMLLEIHGINGDIYDLGDFEVELDAYYFGHTVKTENLKESDKKTIIYGARIFPYVYKPKELLYSFEIGGCSSGTFKHSTNLYEYNDSIEMRPTEMSTHFCGAITDYWGNEHKLNVPFSGMVLEVDSTSYAKTHTVKIKSTAYSFSNVFVKFLTDDTDQSKPQCKELYTNGAGAPCLSYGLTEVTANGLMEASHVINGSYTGTYYLHVWTKQKTNNRIEYRKIAVYMDNSAPSLLTSLSGDTVWKNKNHNLTVSFREYSGLKSVKYCWFDSKEVNSCITLNDAIIVGNEATISYPSSTKSSNGYKIKMSAEDKLGHKATSITSSGTYSVDNVSPTYSKSAINQSYYVKSYDASGKVAFDSDTSGITSIYYCWISTYKSNMGGACSGTDLKTSSLMSAVTGTRYLYASARDGAGNMSNYYYVGSYKFDNTKPTVSKPSGNTVAKAPGSKTESIIFSDAHSGVSGVIHAYCWYRQGDNVCNPSAAQDVRGGSSEILYPVQEVVGKNRVYYILRVRAYDSLGNFSDIQEGSYLIDGTSPGISSTKNSTGVQQSHWAKVTFSAVGGIKKVLYCWHLKGTSECNPVKEVSNGGTIERTGTADTEETFVLLIKAENNVGIASVTTLVFEFDNKEPDFVYAYKSKANKASALEANEVLMMSISEEKNELIEEQVEEYKEEVQENKKEIVKEEVIIKEVEVISLSNEIVVTNTSNGLVIVDYVLATLRNGVFLSSGCFFIKDRKRINIC